MEWILYQYDNQVDRKDKFNISRRQFTKDIFRREQTEISIHIKLYWWTIVHDLKVMHNRNRTLSRLVNILMKEEINSERIGHIS